MTPDEFSQASLGQLAVLTGIDRQRWSRYLTGKVGITDTTLSEVAPKLRMTPDQLLRAIIEHRGQLKKCSRDFSLQESKVNEDFAPPRKY